MNLELTLFAEKQFDIKENRIKLVMEKIFHEIIDGNLTNKNLFNFYRRKEKC